jgi:predicted KAP-like P-loop ATPase
VVIINSQVEVELNDKIQILKHFKTTYEHYRSAFNQTYLDSTNKICREMSDLLNYLTRVRVDGSVLLNCKTLVDKLKLIKKNGVDFLQCSKCETIAAELIDKW